MTKYLKVCDEVTGARQRVGVVLAEDVTAPSETSVVRLEGPQRYRSAKSDFASDIDHYVLSELVRDLMASPS